jgi:hypothetical protein
VRYRLPHRVPVSLVVYNSLGQEVARLVSGIEEAGMHEAKFEAGGLASGIYICRIRAGEFVQARGMMLLK